MTRGVGLESAGRLLIDRLAARPEVEQGRYVRLPAFKDAIISRVVETYDWFGTTPTLGCIYQIQHFQG